MNPRTFQTHHGAISYWISDRVENAPELVFLPGLTADHRLFDKQIEHFEARANCLVWDPPSHGKSRPFDLSWSMDDLAEMLHAILLAEGFSRPILVGQSMGGYVSQAYLDLFPGEAAGFVSVDSCPLQREYYAGWELAALKHTRALYAPIPWKLLVRVGSAGCSTSKYGQNLMRDMMLEYSKSEYLDLAVHGYRVLAEAVEAKRSYEIDCPAMLICGEKDAAGSARRYNRAWSKHTGLPTYWIQNAGHNSNTDAPDEVNTLIEQFVKMLHNVR